jgi:hypothetical protein
MNAITRPREFGAQLTEMKGHLAQALPAGIAPERFMRVTLTAIQLQPELLECDRKSLLLACLRAANDGLMPDGREGAFVVFKTKSGKKAQWMPMFAGLLKKVRNTGELLPPELREILARLRADARPMPMSQLVAVLDAEWGAGWDRHFERFSFTPLAAASIGQVHAARHKDGRPLAIKVQYPGVRESIASDVDNVATLLRISGLLPRGIDFTALLEEAKQQLHDEADYRREGALLARYGELLAGDGNFVLPALIDELIYGCVNQAGEDNRNVARMSALLAGLPVEVSAVTVNRRCGPESERSP